MTSWLDIEPGPLTKVIVSHHGIDPKKVRRFVAELEARFPGVPITTERRGYGALLRQWLRHLRRKCASRSPDRP